MDVASFTINHDKMVRGIYVSRRDNVGTGMVTTFDIRIKVPNAEPVLDNPPIHTMEHLMAVYLRGQQNPDRDKIIYIGPMGCRTGMYLIIKGDMTSRDVLPMVSDMFKFIIDFEGKIPATTSPECGNYLDHNLTHAKWEARKFYQEVLCDMKKENMEYPE